MPPIYIETRAAFLAGSITTLCYVLICECPFPHRCDGDICIIIHRVFFCIWFWLFAGCMYFLYGNVAICVYKTACRVSVGIGNLILNGLLWYHWYASKLSVDGPWWGIAIVYSFMWAFFSAWVYLIKSFVESRQLEMLIFWFKQRGEWQWIVQEINKLPQATSFDDCDQLSCFICKEETTPLLKRACDCKNLPVHSQCWKDWLQSKRKHCTNRNELLMCDVCTRVWIKVGQHNTWGFDNRHDIAHWTTKIFD